jgi:hypothetical protein
LGATKALMSFNQVAPRQDQSCKLYDGMDIGRGNPNEFMTVGVHALGPAFGCATCHALRLTLTHPSRARIVEQRRGLLLGVHGAHA